MHRLLDVFESNCDRHAERAAVCDQNLSLNYAALRSAAAGLAQRIQKETDKPHVGVLAPTSSACAAAIVACWYAGRIPVPLNFLLPPPELSKVAQDAGLDLVLTIQHFAGAMEKLGLKPLTLDARSMAPGSASPPTVENADTGVIIYTSGTTGEPKGVCLTFENLYQNARACIDYARIEPDSIFLSVLPQFHSFGFTAMTVVPLLLGGTVWYLPRFTPLTVTSTIEERGVNVFMATASMYAALSKMKIVNPSSYESLRLAISGGEPLMKSVALEINERFGFSALEGYGLTETSPVVSLNVPWAHRPGSVGRALPGVEVRAIDEQGAPRATSESGELVIRGHCLMRGYHNRPEETRSMIRDGWLHTGDIGHVDADGYIHITGRAKEMMIVGGENVFPREIEATLCDHPAVAEAAVIGVPDTLRGESPLAFVILQEGAETDGAALREFCRERLAGFKVPREVRVAKDLPRGPTGKISKRTLRTSVS